MRELPEVEERSLTPIEDEHLARLGKLVSRAHQELKDRRPELAGTLVAGVLAQGAAAHRVHPAAGAGVKDLDVWLFYARRDGVGKVQERGRPLVYDFGRSSLGRHPGDEGFEGRRVDILTRTIDAQPGADPADAVRAWLARPATSPRLLRQRPVVLLWPAARRGEVLWPGEPPPTAEVVTPETLPAQTDTTVIDVLTGTPMSLSTAEEPAHQGGAPPASGLYAWCAPPRVLPGIAGPRHPTADLELLYVGIAPSRAASGSTLRSRLLANHARGGTGSSTRRRTLAAFLADREEYRTRKLSRTLLVPEDEQRLSGWMRDHLAVTWALAPEPWILEAAVIEQLGPPLNQSGNRAHPLHEAVRAARARWRSTSGS